MHKYELAHIIECEGKKDEEIQSVIGQVRTLIGDLGGRIVKEEVWGQKELAYEINKQNHGFYMFTIMTLEPNKMIEFEKKMRLIDGSMRYLLINLDNEPGYNMEQQTEAMEKSTKEAKEKEEKIETKIEVEETIKPAKAEKKSPKTHEEETGSERSEC